MHGSTIPEGGSPGHFPCLMNDSESMKDLVRKAYRAGTGEDVMAPPDSEERSVRLAFDSRSAALVILVLSILCGLLVGWTASRPVEVHALTANPEQETATGPVAQTHDPGELGSPQSEEPGTGAADTQQADPAPDPAGTVTVYVSGHVFEPGLVELSEGARVALAIEQVGGMTAEADMNALNLARVLTDGEHVVVPAPGETFPAQENPASGEAESGAPPRLINLNTASAADLETLPGVGPAIAQRILEWRELAGTFSSVDELMEVSGIGPATFQQLRDLVTV